jgi:N6-L-threonylcarbamoyladenine synthase
MLILGIDTSCDDTSLALLEDEAVLSSMSANQDEFHARYGGVVPEISARKHLETILPLFTHLTAMSGIGAADIDLVAATMGPGLIGALLVGATFANIFSGTLNKPVIGVHHLEGHLFSTALDNDSLPEKYIALIISGGHTRLLEIRGAFEYVEIGATRDDAAGELIDKTGRLLGFPYPGGRAMDDAAVAYKGEPVKFPEPLISSDDYDFSFSGLKTAVLYYLREHKENPPDAGAVAKGVMTSLANVLARKSLRACEENRLYTLAISGGVSASRFLRERITDAGTTRGINVRFPAMPYTTDNAAMIAAAGYARFKAGMPSDAPIDCKASFPIA